MTEIVYVKFERKVEVTSPNVSIGQLGTIYSSDKALENHIKHITIGLFPAGKNSNQRVCSIVWLIQQIVERYPQAEIVNLGQSDVLVEYKESHRTSKWLIYLKIIILCVAVFLGSAFTIMAFNNDVGVPEVFGKFYYQVKGYQSDGMTEIEFGYCIGLAIGIIVLFNHVGKKRFTGDPTPIQVEMRKYEQEVDETMIQNEQRRGKETDVS